MACDGVQPASGDSAAAAAQAGTNRPQLVHGPGVTGHPREHLLANLVVLALDSVPEMAVIPGVVLAACPVLESVPLRDDLPLELRERGVRLQRLRPLAHAVGADLVPVRVEGDERPFLFMYYSRRFLHATFQ